MISHDQYYLYDSINEHNIYNHVSEFIKHIHYNSMLFIIIITIHQSIKHTCHYMSNIIVYYLQLFRTVFFTIKFE
jgi:cellulose synthase/poly-beta-1,6-N-acetylglucosamine synthase-like glycosyltransferase